MEKEVSYAQRYWPGIFCRIVLNGTLDGTRLD